MTPWAPPSSTRLIHCASWLGTRTSGVMPMPSAAAQIVDVVSTEGRVLHVDIERIVAARLGDHRDIDRTCEAEVHAEHELAGGKFVPHRLVGHAFFLPRYEDAAGLQRLKCRDNHEADEHASGVAARRHPQLH